MPLPFCNITINAINNIDNSTYCVDKMRTDIHSTESDSLVFAVADMELPFNELYTASISLSNYYSSETVQMPVALSMCVRSLLINKNDFGPLLYRYI